MNENVNVDLKEAPYTLEYDINMINMMETASHPFLNKLQAEFLKAGMNPENVTEDDKKFHENLKNLRGNPEYEGTGGEIPVIPDINLDEG